MQKAIPMQHTQTIAESAPYIGHQITGAVVALAPMLWANNQMSIELEVLLAGVFGLGGSAIAVLADKPKTWGDLGARITMGLLFCICFVPYLFSKYGNGAIEALMGFSAVVGIVAWYLAGSLKRFLTKLQDSDIITQIFAQRTGLKIDDKTEEKK